MKHEFRRIALLSTHGYFDPVPKLGRTDTGGQVVYVLELAKALYRMGIQMDIFTRWFDRSLRQIDPVPDHPGVRVVRIPAGSWEFIVKEEIYRILPELAQNMLAFIRRENLDYDLFHAHYVDAGVVMGEVAKKLDRPSFFTAHSLGAWKREQIGGDPVEMEKKFNFNYRVSEEKKIFNAVNALAITSSLQQEKLRSLYGFFKENVEILPPGVNVHMYRPCEPMQQKAETGLPENYIYSLSRIDTNKGHDMLLKAFDIVRKKIDDIYLVIGGGSPNPKAREKEVFDMIEAMIGQLHLGDRVKIIGYVADDKMVSYYQQARLFVMPSLFEPFGMTTQEAMACGKPVIASKYGGIRTVLSDGVNGILVDPDNTAEFADAMINVLHDNSLRERMGHAACELIHNEYSWEVIAEKHLEFYSKYI
jgi:mannosylfructose-phosphate synthase